MTPHALVTLCLAALLPLATQADDAQSPTNPPTSSPAKKADDNACTWFNSIDDWRALDDRHLVVWATRKEFYLVELGTPLFDLRSAENLAFIDHNNDGRICGYGMDEIVIPHSVVFGHSSIVGMTRLDDAALTALGEKYHVKLGDKKKRNKSDDKKPAQPADKEASSSK